VIRLELHRWSATASLSEPQHRDTPPSGRVSWQLSDRPFASSRPFPILTSFQSTSFSSLFFMSSVVDVVAQTTA
jgi:hypothetical protein